jgi:adenylate cyclase
VYADMVGYSRLIELDDAGTARRIRELRHVLIDPAIEEYGGQLVQTGGDSLLVAFDSIDGAVNCAVKIQQLLPQHDDDQPADRLIRFRVGINIGDVIPDGTDLHGEGVNIAARLQAECPPGGICVTRPVRDHVHNRLDVEFHELGPLHLKNINRPVDAFILTAEVIAAIRLQTTERLPENGISEALPLPDKPSIAVLPFANLSGDPDQEYFCDGVVEDITTTLSRTGWLFVIARNSSFAYKGKSPGIRTVGRELGVRYVLDGSVRRAGRRVRISCQLIEAASGRHIWADRIDGELADIFDLQDQISETIANAIEPSLQRAEIVRATSKATESLDAYDLYLRALHHHYLSTQRDTSEALRLLREAITIDPGFGQAKALSSFCISIGVHQEWIAWGSLEFIEAIALARAALVDAPDDPTSLRHAGWTLALLAHDRDAARAVLDRAITLHANSAPILGSSGWVRSFQGDFASARDQFTRAMRLSPLDPEFNLFQTGLAVALIFEETTGPEVGRELTRKALIAKPNRRETLTAQICCLVRLGRYLEAEETARQILSLWPRFTLSAFRRRTPFNPADAERFIDLMRQAGVPG